KSLGYCIWALRHNGSVSGLSPRAPASAASSWGERRSTGASRASLASAPWSDQASRRRRPQAPPSSSAPRATARAQSRRWTPAVPPGGERGPVVAAGHPRGADARGADTRRHGLGRLVGAAQAGGAELLLILAVGPGPFKLPDGPGRGPQADPVQAHGQPQLRR